MEEGEEDELSLKGLLFLAFINHSFVKKKKKKVL